MKFIHYLKSIAGVDIYPLLSLLIFFIFFTLLIVYAIRVDKDHISELENIPLEESQDEKTYSAYEMH